MKKYLTILSLILTCYLANGQTTPKVKQTAKTTIPQKPIPKPVWGKPKVLNPKDDAARRKAEEKSFRPIRKHYFNPNKPI